MRRISLVFFLMASCRHMPEVVPPVAPLLGCLRTLPPLEEPVDFKDSAGGCPAPFEVCLDFGGAKRLAGNIERTRSYLREAVINCYAPASSTDAGVPSSSVALPCIGACYLSSTPP